MLKDLDFINNEKFLFISEDVKLKLLEIIQKDVYFFSKQNIMDYSLLIFIIKKPARHEKINENL